MSDFLGSTTETLEEALSDDDTARADEERETSSQYAYVNLRSSWEKGSTKGI